MVVHYQKTNKILFRNIFQDFKEHPEICVVCLHIFTLFFNTYLFIFPIIKSFNLSSRVTGSYIVDSLPQGLVDGRSGGSLLLTQQQVS
jgi:hypothetical protein